MHIRKRPLLVHEEEADMFDTISAVSPTMVVVRASVLDCDCQLQVV